MSDISKIKLPMQEETFDIKARKVVADIDLPGAPTTNTAASDDNSRKVASTAFVKNVVSNYIEKPVTGVADGKILRYNGTSEKWEAADGITSVSLASGTNNGTLKLTVGSTVTDNVAVTGLGDAAYSNVSAFATAAQGTVADNAAAAIAVLNGDATTAGSVTNTATAVVNTAIGGLSASISNTNTLKTIASITESNGIVDATFQDIATMVGATSSTAGNKGLVPAAGSGQNLDYLRGDGTWQKLEVSVNSSSHKLTISIPTS